MARNASEIAMAKVHNSQVKTKCIILSHVVFGKDEKLSTALEVEVVTSITNIDSKERRRTIHN